MLYLNDMFGTKSEANIDTPAASSSRRKAKLRTVGTYFEWELKRHGFIFLKLLIIIPFFNNKKMRLTVTNIFRSVLVTVALHFVIKSSVEIREGDIGTREISRGLDCLAKASRMADSE